MSDDPCIHVGGCDHPAAQTINRRDFRPNRLTTNTVDYYLCLQSPKVLCRVWGLLGNIMSLGSLGSEHAFY